MAVILERTRAVLSPEEHAKLTGAAAARALRQAWTSSSAGWSLLQERHHRSTKLVLSRAARLRSPCSSIRSEQRLRRRQSSGATPAAAATEDSALISDAKPVV